MRITFYRKSWLDDIFLGGIHSPLLPPHDLLISHWQSFTASGERGWEALSLRRGLPHTLCFASSYRAFVLNARWDLNVLWLLTSNACHDLGIASLSTLTVTICERLAAYYESGETLNLQRYSCVKMRLKGTSCYVEKVKSIKAFA